MNNRVTVASFSVVSQAYLAKAMLESEGVSVFLKDELTSQVANHAASAIGGVKLQVYEKDFEQARLMLVEMGHLSGSDDVPGPLFRKFDKMTASLPLIGNAMPEVRIVVIGALIILLIVAAILLYHKPSTAERLTGNSWCIDKIVYRGVELTPHPPYYVLVVGGEYCPSSIAFLPDGTVIFPGIDRYIVKCNWELRHDSLLLAQYVDIPAGSAEDLFHTIAPKREVLAPDTIYPGAYKLYIKDKIIRMQSEHLTITGNAHILDVRL